MIEILTKEAFKINVENHIYFKNKRKLSNIEFVGYLISKKLSTIINILSSEKFNPKKDGIIINDIFEGLVEQIDKIIYNTSLLSKSERSVVYNIRPIYYTGIRIESLSLHSYDPEEIKNYKVHIIDLIKDMDEKIRKNIIKKEVKNWLL